VVVPVVPKGDRLTEKLAVSASTWDDYTMYKGKERELLAEIDIDLLVEGVDEKLKHLVLSEFIGCLVWLHHPTKQPIHLTGFVNY
jgi:hypothetical protein